MHDADISNFTPHFPCRPVADRSGHRILRIRIRACFFDRSYRPIPIVVVTRDDDGVREVWSDGVESRAELLPLSVLAQWRTRIGGHACFAVAVLVEREAGQALAGARCGRN